MKVKQHNELAAPRERSVLGSYVIEILIKLYKGDCLEEMDKLIKEGVVVDAIICDPPY